MLLKQKKHNIFDPDIHLTLLIVLVHCNYFTMISMYLYFMDMESERELTHIILLPFLFLSMHLS